MNDIIRLLSDNPRLTNKQIAVMLGMEEREVSDAIAKYESEGIIGGYRAVVDWDRIEDNRVTALIELRVTPRRDTGFDAIAQELLEMPEVESVYLMSGAYDFAVYVTGRTIQDISSFVARRLSTIESVQSTATHFVLRRYKDSGLVLKNEGDDNGRMELV